MVSYVTYKYSRRQKKIAWLWACARISWSFALSERDLSFQAISNLSIPVERMYFLYITNNNNNKETIRPENHYNMRVPPKTKYLGQKKNLRKKGGGRETKLNTQFLECKAISFIHERGGGGEKKCFSSGVFSNKDFFFLSNTISFPPTEKRKQKKTTLPPFQSGCVESFSAHVSKPLNDDDSDLHSIIVHVITKLVNTVFILEK